MNKFNPTPGPWRMIARPSTEGYSVNGPEHVICPDVCAISLEQRRDNALLIASAHDLLQAIRDIAAETTKYDSEEIIANIQGICATTIAKVEGRSQINEDCRDACHCAQNAVCTGSIYWDLETRVYTLDLLGTDPFGFGRQG